MLDHHSGREGRARSGRSGFTLLELIVAVSIMAILAGVALPVAEKAFQSRARSATSDELAALGEAVSEYFRDTWTLPGSLDDLMFDPGEAGWSGPYVLFDDVDTGEGTASANATDAWDREYALEPSGTSVLVVRSAGEDGSFGTENDLFVKVDVTPIRRAATLDQLDTINQAITQYNGQYLPATPLSTDYTALLDRLVATDFLPSTAGYASDGWGDAFDETPAGESPVTRVASANVSSAAAAPGGSSGGTGTKGKKPKKAKKPKKGKKDDD